MAVDRDSSLLHVAGYGMADLEQSVPIQPDSAFYAASVSKQFVAMSALLLQEQGKIDLDLPVRTYLPALPEYADRVTTRHLLQHTGGVRDYFTLFALANRLEGLVVTELAPGVSFDSVCSLTDAPLTAGPGLASEVHTG